MSLRVYIDGHVGTTGLLIHERLAGRPDLELLTLSDELRKDADARREQIAGADLAILCLPDDAAVEAARWADDSDTRLIDASTAHRVAEGWVYGLPELAPGQRDAIRKARFVSNPGCYPTGLILLARPLVDAGVLSADVPLVCPALSGYSGGGRSLIERWEDPALGRVGLPFAAPYAIDKTHKHVPEMKQYARLGHEPQFLPSVGPFRCGLRFQLPLHAAHLPSGTSGKSVWEILNDRYRDEAFVNVVAHPDPLAIDDLSFDPRVCNGTNRIDLHVLPNPSGHILLMAVFDNLGKGASGAAVQNLNLMLGLDEAKGLSCGSQIGSGGA